MGITVQEKPFPLVIPRRDGVIEMAPSPEGKGGLWVAKKVPDGEVFVAANELSIREVDPDDPDMLFCKDLHADSRKNTVGGNRKTVSLTGSGR